ncbi:unnamed protein product [Protopolystoma xenopodis]|uniref:Uncharacterized protein n=1 Tax=Protopolystoma xenopodis TaxID=117903 RepID=A0A3S5A784_9PLAT|nr:unnamed protein product [Protopolystoma xenopodis]
MIDWRFESLGFGLAQIPIGFLNGRHCDGTLCKGIVFAIELDAIIIVRQCCLIIRESDLVEVVRRELEEALKATFLANHSKAAGCSNGDDLSLSDINSSEEESM